jgi:hypothetical protein
LIDRQVDRPNRLIEDVLQDAKAMIKPSASPQGLLNLSAIPKFLLFGQQELGFSKFFARFLPISGGLAIKQKKPDSVKRSFFLGFLASHHPRADGTPKLGSQKTPGRHPCAKVSAPSASINQPATGSHAAGQRTSNLAIPWYCPSGVCCARFQERHTTKTNCLKRRPVYAVEQR